MTPDTIIIFAAGHGTRMAKLTKTRPKPLIPVAGKPLIDHALDLVERAGIPHKLVNTHYLGQMIAEHLKPHPDIVISHEAGAALETGGGLKHALPQLGPDPVFTLNSDAIWTHGNPLRELSQVWQPDQMAALLSVVPLENATGHTGRGDFNRDASGRLTRFVPDDGPAYVYTGAQILRTELIAQTSQSRFSFNLIWDQMIANGQLYGCVHPGGWADVGTPQGIELAEALLKEAGNV